MVINILEDITSDLAARVLNQVQNSDSKNIDVNIFSRGGDMMAGNAIRTALELHPAKITTKVFGVAASMAASISQSGDLRLIAEDAIFQPHNGAGLNGARPTKENLRSVADQLEMMDGIMLSSFNKSNLTTSQLKDLLIEDKPLTAQEAIKMAFFDGSIEPVIAEAYLTKITMDKSNKNILDQLKAIKEKFLPTAEEAPIVEAPIVEEVVENTAPSREEFDKLVALVEELIAKMSPLDAPTVTDQVSEQVTAQVAEIFKAIKSNDTVPTATATDLDGKENEETPEVSFLETRQKEVQSKFN